MDWLERLYAIASEIGDRYDDTADPYVRLALGLAKAAVEKAADKVLTAEGEISNSAPLSGK